MIVQLVGGPLDGMDITILDHWDQLVLAEHPGTPYLGIFTVTEKEQVAPSATVFIYIKRSEDSKIFDYKGERNA